MKEADSNNNRNSERKDKKRKNPLAFICQAFICIQYLLNANSIDQVPKLKRLLSHNLNLT